MLKWRTIFAIPNIIFSINAKRNMTSEYQSRTLNASFRCFKQSQLMPCVPNCTSSTIPRTKFGKQAIQGIIQLRLRRLDSISCVHAYLTKRMSLQFMIPNYYQHNNLHGIRLTCVQTCISNFEFEGYRSISTSLHARTSTICTYSPLMRYAELEATITKCWDFLSCPEAG